MKRFSLRTSGVAAVAGIALASSLLFGASTVANAQSVSLSQLVQLFISLGIIDSAHAAAAEAAVANMSSTGSTSSTMSSGYNYTRSLTVGSTGADVTALQNTLIANGDLAAGLNTGYFGALTQAAVAKWQASVGITPAAGYFGPISIAKLNASAPAMTTTTTTTTTNNTSSTVTNTGVEGVLTVNVNPIPSSGQNVYEGDHMDSLLGIKLQAQLSPITIQRVQLDLGNSTAFYTKAFQTLYLVSDSGQVLAQATLNGNTVTKQTSGSTNTYYLTFSGFNYTIPGDNSVHVLTVKGDVYSSIDTSDTSLTNAFGSGLSVPITIDSNGVRGVDGAGVDQYGPASGSISNSVILNKALTNSAQLQISTDSATPLATSVVANSGSQNNEADGVTVLILDAYAQKDNIQIDDLSGSVASTSAATGYGVPTTAYLFDGSTQIGSAAIASDGTFTFQNINYVVPSNTTKALTIKEDIKGAGSNANVLTTTVVSSDVNAENSVGDTVSGGNLSGSATGNAFTVLQKGPVFTLVGTPTASTPNTITSGVSDNATTSASAAFTIGIQAIGSNLYFGTQSASSTFGFALYKNGALFTSTDSTSNDATSTSWSTPGSGVVTTGLSGNNQFELQQNNSVQIPVTFSFQSRSNEGNAILTTGDYAAQVTHINWSLDGNSTNSSTFMASQTSWRTATVHFP